MYKKKIRISIFFIISLLFTIVIGTLLGGGIAQVSNIGIIAQESQQSSALPTKILDRNNKLITTFFASENRKLIAFNKLPRILMLALITREDKTFLLHHGFSVRGTARAIWNLLTNNYVSGGSTLTQQVAGTLYADRREFSILRKLKELWWALQIERSWTKQEIITEYLNKLYFGHGNYGAETASQYYFGHSVTELDYAEAAMLVIQLASPVKYSPFKNPNTAKARQLEILNQMVDLGFIKKPQAISDFNAYWNNYDYTRAGVSSAFLEREDNAPFFSEYIRNILLNELNFTSEDVNTGGYTIYTTLDLDMQKKARALFDKGLARTNDKYLSNSIKLVDYEQSVYPIASLATLLFDNSGQLFEKTLLQKVEATNYFNMELQPVVSLLHLMFDPSPNSLVAHVTYESKLSAEERIREVNVEGALLTIENNTGYIMTMIGGSKFDATNQFNRAADAFVQPGSAFKPLYYAAAIENKIITPSTLILDSPVIFKTEDEQLYVPTNYKGEWKGEVTVREALSKSMNVPSLKILNKVGFQTALETTAKLLDIPKDKWASVGLVAKYPVGLGIVSISPLSMAKAYSTIANGGRKVTPVAIRFIKNRDGKTIHKIEEKVKSNTIFTNQQIITPQTAYVLTSLLQTTVEKGTLAYAKNTVGGFTQPTAGKTGTTQNWSDAWTIGFTAYYTTALWFGFDRGGQSLGTNQTGALTTGPVWAEYMEEINKNLPISSFKKPQGIVNVTINPNNNKIAVRDSEKKANEIFIAGTEPKEYDNPSNQKLIDEYYLFQLEKSRWQLSLPIEPKVDKDVYFDYITTQKQNTIEDTSPLPNLPQNVSRGHSLRLKLDTPSSSELESDYPPDISQDATTLQNTLLQ